MSGIGVVVVVDCGRDQTNATDWTWGGSSSTSWRVPAPAVGFRGGWTFQILLGFVCHCVLWLLSRARPRSRQAPLVSETDRELGRFPRPEGRGSIEASVLFVIEKQLQILPRPGRGPFGGSCCRDLRCQRPALPFFGRESLTPSSSQTCSRRFRSGPTQRRHA